ncbi:hypothetical protein BJV74DRAFT_820874 [Russula compacta]|nr:hypothetical protein BJV74DRAFT_820874 [Russula compacta]
MIPVGTVSSHNLCYTMAGPPSQRVLDNLKSFARAVWGNPKSKSIWKRSSTGVDYIDLTDHVAAARFLFGSAGRRGKILVREEYHVALRALETEKTYTEGAYVTGQPGIGKTLFLAYVLVVRLEKQQTVAWQPVDGSPFYVLLRDTATIHSISDTDPLDDFAPIWGLSDSNFMVRTPPSIFVENSPLIRAIQATSPRRDRWKDWSKHAGAECYVMDIWSEMEIAHLAGVLNLDAGRMTFLAREWGGVPRTLLHFLDQGLSDELIEEDYEAQAPEAVRKCNEMVSSVVQNDLPGEAPSRFFFCRPHTHPELGVNRRRSRTIVPTATLLRILGEALQMQDNNIRLAFFPALKQYKDTRSAAGFIYENWFHNFLIAGRTINCEWLQGFAGVRLLRGVTSLIVTSWDTMKVEQPPYYWVAPDKFPGIDSALVLEDAIYAIQVTMSSKHESPSMHLPHNLKKLPWRVLFVGDTAGTAEAAASEWAGKILFPTKKMPLAIGWSKVDPVDSHITYKILRDESKSNTESPDDEPDEELDEASTEVDDE